MREISIDISYIVFFYSFIRLNTNFKLDDHLIVTTLLIIEFLAIPLSYIFVKHKFLKSNKNHIVLFSILDICIYLITYLLIIFFENMIFIT